jgi:tetratricopeptide (TPR) repeat protein
MRLRTAARLALLILLSLLVPACATWRGPDFAEAVSGLPDPVELHNVPFHPQTEYHCGPAALASVLEHSGRTVAYRDLVDRVYLPGRLGSLQAEMLAATRASGRIAYRLPHDLSSVFAEIADGRPVLVLENQGLVRYPVWHYAVIIGYDTERRTLTQHSGEREATLQPLPRWIRQWRRAGQWAMVAMPPGQLPATEDPVGWIQAVADFEAVTDTRQAHKAWLATLERWPDQPVAWLGLGNSTAELDDPVAAMAAFEQALALDPSLAVARFNLAVLAERQHQPCKAERHLQALKDHPQLAERVESKLKSAHLACQQ